MPIANVMKSFLNRKRLQPIALPLINGLARAQKRGVQRIFLDGETWIHQTSRGYFAYHQPYLRLNLRQFDECAHRNFFWGYEPSPGDIIVDVGAGVGEETLTFSRVVGERGKVICVEAHPRTYRCLEKMVRYNGLQNVIPIHAAVIEPGRSSVTIENGETYLANRLGGASGITVPALTVDQIFQRLQLERVHFLKMNIEGAEQLAIQGMDEAVQRTEVLCVSCHDFLAKPGDGEYARYCSKNFVRKFLRQNGLNVAERYDSRLPPYIRDQVWGCNWQLMRKPAA